MLALSLATGIVIDDAIVVLENIFRFVEEKGVRRRKRPADATQEIGLAVMATTLSLVVIFVPVAFMTGQIGRYFYSFGLTSAAAILLSMFVSFTLTPALCAMWLKKEDVKSDHSTTKSAASTRRSTPSTARCWSGRCTIAPVMMAIAGVVVLSAAFLYPYVGKELVPDDDQGEFSINVRLPRGTSYQRTEEFIKPIEKEVLALPDLQRVMQNVNSGFANFNIMMVPLEERKISQQELMIRRGRCCASTRARASACRAAPTSPARRRRRRPRRRRRRRRRRRLQPPQHPHPGAGHRAAAGVHRAADGQGARRFPASSTSTPTSSRRSPSCGSTSTARARPTSASTSTTLANNLRTLVGGEEVSEFKDGDDQFKVLLRLDEPYRNGRRRWAKLLVRGRDLGRLGGGRSKSQRRRDN
jgi:HAE1 family hydrophobic/amphiphilic exporter-1